MYQRVMIHLPLRFSRLALYVPVVRIFSLSAAGTTRDEHVGTRLRRRRGLR
jgi:hypothetical protein